MELIHNIFETLFKMKWLSNIISWLLIEVLGMNAADQLYSSVHFFIYHSIKIFILIGISFYIISFIQSYLPQKKIEELLLKAKGFKAYLFVALFGMVTPLCSCTSVPIFMAIGRAGLPVGVTVSFLIAAPLLDLASLILLTSIFSVEFAAVYAVSGLLIAIIVGIIVDKINIKHELKPFFYYNEPLVCNDTNSIAHCSVLARNEVRKIYKKVWVFVLIDVTIGAIIYNYVPLDLVEWTIGGSIISVIIVIIVGIPLYAEIIGTLAIGEALLRQGVGSGTILALIMSVTALSFPSIIMLNKAMKRKTLVKFVAIVAVAIFLVGISYNIIERIII